MPKTIMLASEFFINGAPDVIEQPFLDGDRDEYAIEVRESAGPETTISAGVVVRMEN